MRILIMVHSLTGGGAERVAALWATGFVERGYEVGIVLNCGKSTPITYHVPDKVKIYNLSDNLLNRWIANKLNRRLGIDLYFVKKLKTIIYSFQPDILIGVMQPWAEWARKATKGTKIPIINTEHYSFEWPKESGRTKKMWQQKYEWNKQYDYVTVLTDADKKCVNEILSNVAVLPNPLAFPPAKQMPTKEKIILAVGRLDAWYYKGFDLLIKVWGKIAKQYPDWKLQIAGNSKGKGREFLQSLADEMRIGKQLEFLGYQNDMLPIYQRASIFVLSSRYEGFGMVLIEAMSQGCAPIVCDYKGRQSEIITSSDDGLICPVEDVDALTNSIQEVIRNEAYRTHIQINAIERAKFFSVEKTIDRWEEIFKKLDYENFNCW